MEKVCIPDLSWPTFCARSRFNSSRRGKVIPLRYVDRGRGFQCLIYFNEQVANSRLCTKTPFTTIVISGASILARTHGKELIPRYAHRLVLDTGKQPLYFSVECGAHVM